MKCYNCDHNITKTERQCPNCNIRIDRSLYEVDSTDKILNKIKNIKDFAHFIGLFYVKSYIFLIVGLLCLGFAIYGYIAKGNNVIYIVFTLIFIVLFNYFLEMRKVENFYKDFQRGDNKYYILYPFRTERRIIVCDASDKIFNQTILNQRYHAYESRDSNVRMLRINSHKFIHPQKLKLFYTKEKFYKRHFAGDARHVIKTGNYEDESYVGLEGVCSGFLMTKNGVVTIYNAPKITKEVLPETKSKLYVKPKRNKTKNS